MLLTCRSVVLCRRTMRPLAEQARRQLADKTSCASVAMSSRRAMRLLATSKKTACQLTNQTTRA